MSSSRTIADNIYSIGLHITAKHDPGQQLVIVRYYQRIYYCSIVDKPAHKQLAYFERELLSPK